MSREIKINQLVAIKNYEAGCNGSMLVALDENLSIEGMYGKKGDKSINLLICTANVKCADQEVLMDFVDDDSPVDTIIIVSKKFLKMSNRKQLALLEIHNSGMTLEMPETSESRRVYGEYCAIERFGKITVKMATRKAERVKNKSLNKATRGVHWQHKKELMAARKEAANGGIFNITKNMKHKDMEFDFEEDDELFEDAAMA